jgi:molybdopterin-guanine dinucleotide biosynthesis protein B
VSAAGREQRTPAVVAVCGPKNSGKTTLLANLIPALQDRGIAAAVIKHDGHSFAADREGTDTWRMLQAGACGAAIFDGEKFQAVKYASVTEADLIALYPEADMILLEGFKWTAWPKIEIVRQGVSMAPLCNPDTLLALVTDTDCRLPGIPAFAFEDTGALADLLAAQIGTAPLQNACSDRWRKE